MQNLLEDLKELLQQDELKVNFLKQLRVEHFLEQLWKSKSYIIWSMPFFNESLRKTNFSKELDLIIKQKD